MRDTLRGICELQPHYTNKNTPQMQRRGQLIRQALREDFKAIEDDLAKALGPYGNDFYSEGKDGQGNKTELAWFRFCSKRMSPKATKGFYVVLHFSTDGSGVNIAVGCSSLKFQNGSAVRLPTEEIQRRATWLRQTVLESRGTQAPFTDSNNFGASIDTTKAFQEACPLVKKIKYDDIEDENMNEYLIKAAKILRIVYDAQIEGRELSSADQDELEIIDTINPLSNERAGQGYGLTAQERRVVEQRAMKQAAGWLSKENFTFKDTSANKPYDFEAKKANEVFYVEVKGTTSDNPNSIMMTHREVELHHEKKGNTILIIVSSIRLNRHEERPDATEGHIEVFEGWNIEEWLLEPTSYRVTRLTERSCK